jgi:hypothetical protein
MIHLLFVKNRIELDSSALIADFPKKRKKEEYL